MLSITYTRDALKFVKGLETKPARQIYEKTISLTSEPRPSAATELRGFKGYLRLRVGDFRVIYSITPEAIKVVLIDNRADDEVYRHLERLSLS